MIQQRKISLNPTGMEAVKITYPPIGSRRGWVIEPMRFVVHSGKAAKPYKPRSRAPDGGHKTWCQQCEQKVSAAQATACLSLWCKAKARAE